MEWYRLLLIFGIFIFSSIFLSANGICMEITDSDLTSGEVAKAIAEKHEDYVIKMRREFHMHPELSLKEKWTSERVIKELDSMGIPYEVVGKYGIIATIK